MINKVTFETACLLMIFDSVPNIFLFAKIIRSRGKIESSKTQEQKTYAESEITMDSLALKELFEVLIPSVYCITFVIAFYGPNAEVIGNVKNDYWQYKRVSTLVII